VQDIHKHPNIMIASIITGNPGTQEVLVDINILLDIRPKEPMQFQNKRETQVCLMSNIKRRRHNLDNLQGGSGSSSHQHLMEGIGRVKILNTSCWA